MKKILFILTFLVFAAVVSSCGVSKNDFESFKKDNAITDYNSSNYVLSKKWARSISVDGDYYRQDGNYYSLFTNQSIGTSITDKYIGMNKVYFNNIGLAYDSFGSELPTWFTESLSYSKSYYIMVAENSPLYYFLSHVESKEKTIHLIKIDVLKANWGECGYIVKEKNDTHFLARNVFSSLSEIGISESDLIPSNASIVKLNETEYSVNYNGNSYRYRYYKDNYSHSSYDTYVLKTPIYDGGYDDEYTTLFEFELAYNDNPFYYKVKKVSGYSNDFSFVYNGTKYKAKCENGYNQKTDINFYPVDLKVSKNRDYCYVLCHKVDEDGNLSNKYYVLKIDSNFHFSKFTDDISLFDDNQYIYFNGRYQTLQEKEKLLVLNDSVMITKKENFVCFNTSSYSHYLFDSPTLVNNYSINSKYIFTGYDDFSEDYYISIFDYSSNTLNKYYYDELIISEFCVYELDNKLMCFDEVIHYGAFMEYYLDQASYSVFGSSNITYVLTINEYNKVVANYILSLNN